jgi:AbrB family looped-hinge helix DNA binding protein
MQAITKLSDKFQISIPKAIRDAEHWEAGQRFAFVPQDGGYLLVAVPSRDDLFGIAAGAETHDIRDRRDRT